jgi:hypothetical protein
MQRRALQQKHAQVGRAIRAIEAAERALQTDELAGTPALRKIIEVIRVQDAIEAMKRYYRTDEEWEKRKRYYEEGPGPDWRTLYRDAAALLGEDPASEKVQSLADRWLVLTVRAASGDPNRTARLAKGLGRSRTLASGNEGTDRRVPAGGDHGIDTASGTLCT